MVTRNEILEAADHLFGEVGFDAATTREIAVRSGVNKALIHYHFKTKEALLESVLDRYYERLSKVLQQAVGDDGSAREQLGRVIDTYVDFLARNRSFSRIVQREASGGRHSALIRARMTPLFELGTQLVETAYPATQRGDMAASQLLVSFYGMIVAYFTYSETIEGLMTRAPLSKRGLDERRRHLRKMLDLVIDTIENEPAERKEKR